MTIPMRFYHNYTTTSQIANKASTLYSCSFIPTKMGDCYHSLSKSISSSSKWTPHIMVKSTHFREDSDGIITPNYSGTVELVDICRFFDQSHCILIASYQAQTLQYPSSALIQLEGFNGIDDKDQVIEHVKQCARDGDTFLSVRSSKRM